MNGLRVTDEETMEIAEMVLGRVNKNLVTMVEELGVKAVGISGNDGGLLKVTKKYANGEDIGYVGEIEKVDPKVLYDLLEKMCIRDSFWDIQKWKSSGTAPEAILIRSMRMYTGTCSRWWMQHAWMIIWKNWRNRRM